MKAEMGSVSHGTMRNEDLLQAFASTLESLRADDSERTTRHATLIDEAYAIVEQYADDADSVDEETASDVVNELFDALNCYAPDGCYFGANEGDGSDYGFWSND